MSGRVPLASPGAHLTPVRHPAGIARKLLAVASPDPSEGPEGWLAPDETWPDHPRSEAQKAMSEARRAGFRLRPMGHPFGKLRCDGHDDGEVHVLTVSRTPRGDAHGTATAKKIRSKVRQCLRRRQGPAGDLSGDVETLLEQAEGLAQAATAYWRSEQLGERKEAELAAALEGGSDQALDRAAELEERQDDEVNFARRGLERFGLGDRIPPAEGARELIELATEALGAAEANPLTDEQRGRALEVRATLEQPWR